MTPVGAEQGEASTSILARPGVRYASTVAAIILALVIISVPIMGVPWSQLLYGVVVGSTYSLEAVALILIYRSNRIINFALAEIGAFGAVIFENLDLHSHVPWGLALPIGVASAGILGFLLETFIGKRFANSSRLIYTVATLGMTQLVAAGELYIVNAFSGSGAQGSIRTPLSALHQRIEGFNFDGNSLVLVAMVPLVILALHMFLHRTHVGIAMRASAENAPRASLLGVPVRTVSTLSWVLASVIGALAICLRSPITGLVSGSSAVGPEELLGALTVAVIARFSDLKTAVWAGWILGAGLTAATYTFAASDPNAIDPMFVAVLVLVILFQRKHVSRIIGNSDSSWKAYDEVRRLPARIRNHPKVRILTLALAALGALIFVAAPALNRTIDYRSSDIIIYGIVAISVVVVTGWSGQISLGQLGFAAIGAGVAGRLTADAKMDFFLSLVLSGLAGAAVSVVLGLVAARLKGFYFAVVSLGFAVAAAAYFLDPSYFPLLAPNNQVGRPKLFGSISTQGDLAFYYLCLALLVVLIAGLSALRRSRTGRALIAMKDNDRAARSYGISQTRSLLLAFGIAGFVAAIGGALFTAHDRNVSLGLFPPEASITVFAMAVVGGLGSLPGAVAGAVLSEGATLFLKSATLSEMANGVLLLAVLLFMPGGLAELFYKGRDWVIQRLVPASVLGNFFNVRGGQPSFATGDQPAGSSITPAAVSPSGNGSSVGPITTNGDGLGFQSQAPTNLGTSVLEGEGN